MSIVGVVDTHAPIWYLYDDKRLSENAGQFIDDAAVEGHKVAVSPISLVETIYLVEKGRVKAQTLPLIVAGLKSPDNVFVEIAFDLDVAQALQHVSRVQVPEMPDRIIAATALHLRVPVVSRDMEIQLSDIKTIW